LSNDSFFQNLFLAYAPTQLFLHQGRNNCVGVFDFHMKKSSDLFFLACLLTLLLCAMITISGRIAASIFYDIGQVLQLLGTLGGGVAVAGIGIFELLYPGHDILTRWKPIPLLVRQIVGRLVGIAFLLVAMYMIFSTILRIIG
jgi:hypothetical protein